MVLTKIGAVDEALPLLQPLLGDDEWFLLLHLTVSLGLQLWEGGREGGREGEREGGREREREREREIERERESDGEVRWRE